MRAGALAFLAAGAACEDVVEEIQPTVVELANDTITLADGVELVDVTVRRSEDGDFDPLRVSARTGDLVRFTAGDNGGHAVMFDAAAVSDTVRTWLESTAQLRGPPLIDSGSAWVITLETAPPGEYPFRCTTHNAAGHLTVRPR